MFRTDNPHADFDRWEAEREAELERLPECTYCGDKIQDDYLYEINDELICERCLRENFRKETNDYVK